MLVTVIEGVLIAGAVVIAALGVAFEVFCLVALVNATKVRRLPKWAWAVLIVCTSALGGLAFLSFGLDLRSSGVPGRRDARGSPVLDAALGLSGRDPRWPGQAR